MVSEDMSFGDDDDAAFDEQMSDEDLLQEAGEWDDKIARYNTIHLTGRIGTNPEPRYFDDGKVVVNLSLAARRKYHSLERVAEDIKSSEDEETDWYALEIWGQTAEFVAKYVDKGARVGVIGSLQVDEWSDRESGESRSKAKVVVRDFDLLETRTEAEARRSNRRTSFYQEEQGRDNGGVSPAGSGGFFD
jgi:single-strand DNA-binding protein